MQRIGIKILPDFLERMISRHQLVAVGKIDTIHARIHMWRTAHQDRSEEHTSELQSQSNLVCRLLLEKKKQDRTPDLSSRMRRRMHVVLCGIDAVRRAHESDPRPCALRLRPVARHQKCHARVARALTL